MIWMTFEILINFFQAYIVLHYIKNSFIYSRETTLADITLLTSFTLYFSIYLFFPTFPLSQQLVFLLPLLHALLLSSEPKISILFWILVLVLTMNLVSVLTYPIFDLLPIIFDFIFSSFHFERFLCIIVTNLTLFLILELIVRLKKNCTFPKSSSYVVFILTLSIIYIIEESIYDLYLAFSNEAVLSFFTIYVGLLGCITLSVFLFHTVSSDSEKESRYQAEISLLNHSKQHQQELAQMYEELTERQHDYKHHLQVLQELVDGKGHSTAQDYLQCLISENEHEKIIVTGSPSVDALLTAKQKIMMDAGIQFEYTPYPLASLPISTLDFCSIIGNLLDNAIEGIRRISLKGNDMEPPTIHLSFSRSWDMFYIYCENPCDPETVVKHKDLFVSSKSKTEPGLHGLGLHSIDAIASKAQGRTEYSVQNKVFYAKVVLPYLNQGRLYS
ncbi:MAG: GHKL domain-containing protein [Firmicutes bacterium]|nr:GHKL domain-containing protein [Bacillota bacterium]